MKPTTPRTAKSIAGEYILAVEANGRRRRALGKNSSLLINDRTTFRLFGHDRFMAETIIAELKAGGYRGEASDGPDCRLITVWEKGAFR